MQALESSTQSKLTQGEIVEAGNILFESFKNGDQFTSYSLEWINGDDTEKIIQDYYQRIVIFFDSIDGLTMTKDWSGKVNSVGTFISHNTTKSSIATAEKNARLNIPGLITLMFNRSIHNPYAKLRALKRFGHLVNFTDKMRVSDVWGKSHIYAQYLWANGKDWSGIRLLLKFVKSLKESRIPIYFWTVSKQNYEMYWKLGFECLWEAKDPVSGLSFWRFLCDPGESGVEVAQIDTKSAIKRVLERN